MGSDMECFCRRYLLELATRSSSCFDRFRFIIVCKHLATIAAVIAFTNGLLEVGVPRNAVAFSSILEPRLWRGFGIRFEPVVVSKQKKTLALARVFRGRDQTFVIYC